MGRERQDASETVQPYSFSDRIAMKYNAQGGAAGLLRKCAKGNSFSSCGVPL